MFLGYKKDLEEFRLNSKKKKSKKGFKLTNYGSTFFYPQSDKLTNNLEKVIIFTENSNSKHLIPNGSIWTYKPTCQYNPQILKSDVGCGMSLFTTEFVDWDEQTAKEITKILEKEKIKIGRGNHFINFMNNHPQFSKNTSSIMLHSDFNQGLETPQTFQKAFDLMRHSYDKRRETLETITSKLGIKAEFYKDWTHNSVEKNEDEIIYRKGSINLEKTDGEGMLALNPFDGIYYYAGNFKNMKNSMQHGAGKKSGYKCDISKIPKIKSCKIETLLISQSQRPQDLYQEYNTNEEFLGQFSKRSMPLGFSKSKLISYTG